MDRKMIEEGVKLIIKGIGEDINREGLKGTPERVAEMYEEIFSGIGKDPSEELGPVFDENHDEIILVKDIPFYSVCEHHMVPFTGKAHIAYVPNKAGRIIGLSKLVRVLDITAKRLQVQERLTSIVADTIMKKIKPRGVLVIVEAEHLCMSMRGVRKPGTLTVTSAVRGLFRENPASRAEVMALIKQNK
ncbi:MAG: GTP cyclohydrolase I FolE [Actinobacteria bacterium RBG_19FT_COMBO_36_27]|nr:MAG: GTP cyclohydrolase I FolE [Actinobacteria bacterium RBG_19FT_COMBO_36_27]OGD35573.1 MAG: GTP cyclohydrolase I FolE [Candidatus Atribacteria bacterium RBG_16_35_8]